MTTTLSPASAFLAAICDTPADDHPRLVYADWLEEQGDAASMARAEYIRVAIELVRNNPPSLCGVQDSPQGDGLCLKRKCIRCRLLRRRWHLWRHHGCEWQSREFGQMIAEHEVRESLRTGQPIRHHWTDPPMTCEYRRGFIEMVSMTMKEWMQWGPRLIRQCPLMEVRGSDYKPFVSASPSFDWWSDKAYKNHEGDESNLPDVIFRLLTGGEHYWEGSKCWRYDSLAAAQSVLSQALLTWARQQNERTTP